ncbi:uncharacterized protein LOC105425845 [Pogonomyrmex barbatus]|uniref:Uncharacterized protein LOC105425845 n=1 Tax=Pogonomyrmex barbatus TaxID=144034 RepID=A0A6I9W1X5_9HYME|nr:uncharacterized protein LOC105425845 [Pogonomyrmex barbatus]
MQSSLPDQKITCLGKCLDNMTKEELNGITENIHNTLIWPKGNELFTNYLEQYNFRDSLECLNLYNKCSECLAEKKKQLSKKNLKEFELLESLFVEVRAIKEIVEDLDGIPELDMDLMKQFNEALKTRTNIELLAVLEETRIRCRNYLRKSHEGFKEYVVEQYSLKLKCKNK